MNYNIDSISTQYNGITFRSRLEAKWACLFDLLGWTWQYEPIDFGGWSPDFVILEATTVFVEVKPVFDFPQEVADKIDASGCKDEVLIVGACCPLRCDRMRCNMLGWLREERFWCDAPVGLWKGSNRIGFCHASHSYQDRISGGYDGGSFGKGHLPEGVIEQKWRMACNVTQWKR